MSAPFLASRSYRHSRHTAAPCVGHSVGSLGQWSQGKTARDSRLNEWTFKIQKRLLRKSRAITLPMMVDSVQSVSRSLVSSLPDLRKMKIRTPVDLDPPGLLNSETLALSEDQASKQTSAGGDGAEQARLFGIYTGQIQARIDRVWRRPRTPVSEADGTGDSFQCEAANCSRYQGKRTRNSPATMHRVTGVAALTGSCYSTSLALASSTEFRSIQQIHHAELYRTRLRIRFLGRRLRDSSA